MKDEWVVKVHRFNLTTGSQLEEFEVRPYQDNTPYNEIVRMAALLTEQKYIVCYNPSSIFAVSQALNTQWHVETVWTEEQE